MNKLTRTERLAAFVERHKVAIATVATAAVTTVVVARTVNALRDDNLDAALKVIENNGLTAEFENYFEEN